MRINQLINGFLDQPLGLLTLILSGLIASCVAAIFIAIMINFAEARTDVVRERRSIVATGSMTAFFIVVYLVIARRIGVAEIDLIPVKAVLMLVGTIMVMLGTAMNVWGRLYLRGNWANHVRIYAAQTLVRTGPYALVRHPLYASLIWMFIGAGLVYQNWLAIVLTLIVFIPFMRYRAHQEEAALCERFPEYDAYRRSTGMFFPRILRWRP
jgi:protein-S-isoprenylcysteine O-methyltransferase Ste14